MELGPGRCSLACLLAATLWWLFRRRNAQTTTQHASPAMECADNTPQCKSMMGMKEPAMPGVDDRWREEAGVGVFMKKWGRRGRPHECVVRVEADRVTWTDKSKERSKDSKDRSMNLSDVKRVHEGTFALQGGGLLRWPSPSGRDGDRCFSLVSRSHTLDLQAESKQTRDRSVTHTLYTISYICCPV